MHLLLINYEYPPIGGGAGSAMWNISRELVRQAHQVTILTASYKELRGWDEDSGIQVYRCWALRQFDSHSNLLEYLSFVVSAAISLPKVLKNRDIDGVMVYFSIPNGPLGLLCKILKGLPYVILLRGGDVPGNTSSVAWLHYLLTPLRRYVLKYSLATVANSTGLKQLAQQADPFFPIKVVHNGVDTHFFYPQNQQTEGEIFGFLFVGRLDPGKNLFFLLEQLSKFKKISSTTAKFICHIVGEGKLRKSLQEYAVKLDIDSKIFWHGWVIKKELRAIYQQSDCLLNPSLNEGMPNVVLEAMACGLPVIASNVAGNDAVVRHNQTGYLFDLSKEKEFQTALQSLLTNRNQARQFGKMGRDWVVKEFSWANVAKEYVQLFREQK